LKFLLDTHIWIWSMALPSRLGGRVLRSLRDPGNELWLSPVSTWEALLLHGKGRVVMEPDVHSWLTRALTNLREAPLTHEIVLAAQGLSFAHRDPADRFLAATAKVLGLTLITADPRLLGLADIASMANR